MAHAEMVHASGSAPCAPRVRLTPVRSRGLRAMLLFWLIIAVLLTHYYALIAQPHSPLLSAIISRPDLVFHLVAFAAMALPAFLLWRPAAAVAMGFVVLAGMIELLQVAVPKREASFADFATSGAGILPGALAAIVMLEISVRRAGALAEIDRAGKSY